MVTPSSLRPSPRTSAGSTSASPRAPRKAKHTGASAAQPLPHERMRKVDTAWLRMDSPSNLMMINGVWCVSPGISLQALRERASERLLQYPRFRQCAVEDATGASWVDDAQFDITAHVVPSTLVLRPGQSPQAALQERVGALAMQPLDRQRPLWQFHLIEDFVGDDGQPASALILRIHHCIADGIALIAVALSLVDGSAQPPRRAPAAPAAPAISAHTLEALATRAVQTLGNAGDCAAQSLQWLLQPEKILSTGLAGSHNAAHLAQQLVRDAAALAFLPDDSPTQLKGTPGTTKRVAWCPPIALDEVKAIGRALNCSVNDVLMSCVAGALGSYLHRHGEGTEGTEIRAMVPVNLRASQDTWELGNHFGLAPLLLPLGMTNPIERVYEVRQRMNALKGSLQPLLSLGLLAVAGSLHQSAQNALLQRFSNKTTAVVTNVPGPSEPLVLCGARVTQCMFWVPQSGNVGLGVSILSYGGGVQFGVMSDTRLCPEPQHIIDAFAPQFEQLSLLTLMLPWGE